MRKLFLIIVLSQLIFSCSDSSKKTSVTTKDQGEAGVQNVNGNIPDTTNAINLSTHKKDAGQPGDSIKK